MLFFFLAKGLSPYPKAKKLPIFSTQKYMVKKAFKSLIPRESVAVHGGKWETSVMFSRVRDHIIPDSVKIFSHFLEIL